MHFGYSNFLVTRMPWLWMAAVQSGLLKIVKRTAKNLLTKTRTILSHHNVMIELFVRFLMRRLLIAKLKDHLLMYVLLLNFPVNALTCLSIRKKEFSVVAMSPVLKAVHGLVLQTKIRLLRPQMN